MSNLAVLRRAVATRTYLSPEQVCDIVPGMTTTNLQELRKKGLGPKYFKPTGDGGRIVLYAEDDVRAWIEASVHKTRDQQ